MLRHKLLFLIGITSILFEGCANFLPLSREAGVAIVDPNNSTPPPHQIQAPNAVDTASMVAVQALSHLGVPYRSGGLSPRTGFDCSGLVAYVYREGAALDLPRNTFALSQIGEPIERTELKPGDLVFYNTQHRDYSHVGIYLGEDRFIHAPSSRGEVRVESLGADYWTRRYNGARRIIAQK